MDIQQFEKHIKEAVLMVPEHLREKIKNLAFVVEEDVRPAGLKEQRINFRGILLGLYQGIPLPRRSGNYSAVLPDKITIFKKSIESLAGSDEKKHYLDRYCGRGDCSRCRGIWNI